MKINPGVNNIFASVYSNHKGYNVAIFEVDKTNDSTVFLLHKSESSDLLAIEPIADIIKPFTANGFMGCYFNFVENDKANLVPNGVIELIGGKRGFTKANENPTVSLTNLALKINGGAIKIKSQLAGSIQADLKYADIDDMSHQIANLIHITDNWNRFVNGDNIEVWSSGSSRTSVTDSLEGFLGFDRYYL
jgi:hypothetical protein